MGLDDAALSQWLKRMKDIETFEILPTGGDFKPALKAAFEKYHVDYIVFMKYSAPKKLPQRFFKKIYGNKHFLLYKILKRTSI